jgi:hypothetical protein
MEGLDKALSGAFSDLDREGEKKPKSAEITVASTEEIHQAAQEADAENAEERKFEEARKKALEMIRQKSSPTEEKS